MLRKFSIQLRLVAGFATLLVCLCTIAAAGVAGFQYLNEQIRVYTKSVRSRSNSCQR